jgi:muconolactone delta-isomerase
MQFLTISRRRTERFTEEQFAARIPQEIARARVLYAEGFFRQLWHRADVPGGCLLVEAESEAEVREKINTLPLAQAEMLDYSIIPLKPYMGFCPPAADPPAQPEEQ